MDANYISTAVNDPSKETTLCVLKRALSALALGFKNVSLKSLYYRRIIEYRTALKMQKQTSIVKIYRTKNRKLVIAYTTLCMNKPRGVFIYLHSCLDKLTIIASRKPENHLLSAIPGIMMRTSTPRLAALIKASKGCHQA